MSPQRDCTLQRTGLSRRSTGVGNEQKADRRNFDASPAARNRPVRALYALQLGRRCRSTSQNAMTSASGPRRESRMRTNEHESTRWHWGSVHRSYVVAWKWTSGGADGPSENVRDTCRRSSRPPTSSASSRVAAVAGAASSNTRTAAVDASAHAPADLRDGTFGSIRPPLIVVMDPVFGSA